MYVIIIYLLKTKKTLQLKGKNYRISATKTNVLMMLTKLKVSRQTDINTYSMEETELHKGQWIASTAGSGT